jgi:hypothetical protein
MVTASEPRHIVLSDLNIELDALPDGFGNAALFECACLGSGRRGDPAEAECSACENVHISNVTMSGSGANGLPGASLGSLDPAEPAPEALTRATAFPSDDMSGPLTSPAAIGEYVSRARHRAHIDAGPPETMQF